MVVQHRKHVDARELQRCVTRKKRRLERREHGRCREQRSDRGVGCNLVEELEELDAR